jgi:hypothetical protein
MITTTEAVAMIMEAVTMEVAESKDQINERIEVGPRSTERR